MAQLLPYLLFLLCPVSMGVMMRPNRQASPPSADPRIAELESQVAELRSALRSPVEQPRQEG